MALRDGRDGVPTPDLPPGATIELPGRGTTFVRSLRAAMPAATASSTLTFANRRDAC